MANGNSNKSRCLIIYCCIIASFSICDCFAHDNNNITISMNISNQHFLNETVFQNVSHEEDAVNDSSTRWLIRNDQTTPKVAFYYNRQQRVHSLRNTLHHRHPTPYQHSHKVNSESSDNNCDVVLRQKIKIVLVRALTTWAHMNFSDGDDESDNWIEILASAIISVSASGNSHCLARVAVNTVRLLLLDEIKTCSKSDNSRIVELVTSSQKSLEPWRQKAIADYGEHGDDFGLVLSQLARAQRRLFNETDWQVGTAACFNSEDTAFDRRNRSRSQRVDEMFDSAAIDALLFLSLGYLPDVKCPPVDVGNGENNVEEHEDHAEGEISSFFERSLMEIMQVDDITEQITIEEFDHLLSLLGIGAVRHDEDGHSHHHHHQRHHHSDDSDEHEEVDIRNHCFSSNQLLNVYGFNASRSISYKNFVAIFPALIQQQLSKACTSPSADEKMTKQLQPSTLHCYGFGTLSVLIISVVSMIFLLIIPSTKRQNYRYIMSAFIALSASTMLGDALLHLLPQALAIHNHRGHREDDIDANIQVEDFVLKQLITLCAIYAFYLFEMLVSGRHHARHQKLGHDHGHSHMPDFGEFNNKTAPSDDNQQNQFETIHHYASPRPVVVLETFKPSTSDNSEQGSGSSPVTVGSPACPKSLMSSSANQPRIDGSGGMKRSESDSAFHESSIIDAYFEMASSSPQQVADDNAVFTVPSLDSGDNKWHIGQAVNSSNLFATIGPVRTAPVPAICESPSIITAVIDHDDRTIEKVVAQHQLIRQQRTSLENLARECVPKKTLGWMVIIGDSLHNVIDGIAIGAAFSEDLVSGLSTSIAIACHEIPHEVGDFAALLTAGLTWRAALVWNVIHTLLAFAGLYIGVGIATEVGTRQWVFALTAGMFIYVSLTEMLPELTRVSDNFWRYFAWQNVGFLFGFGLMLMIAIFEDKIALVIKRSYYFTNGDAPGN